MSEETGNEKNTTNNISETPGFRTALYFNLNDDNVDLRLKEAAETLEVLRINSSDLTQTPTMTPRQSDTYKNYISSDLLQRLEESSPIKYRKSEEYMRRLSEMYLCNNNEGDDVSNNTSKRGSNVEESHMPLREDEIKKDSEGNLLSNVTNFATRNYKLKTHMMNKHEEETAHEYSGIGLPKMKPSLKLIQKNKDEPKSLFTNTMNFSTFNNHQPTTSTNFSPTYNTKQVKQSRRDSSPIYTYYDGTAECLSQTFYDEFKKSNNDKFMSKNNFIKKGDPVILPEETDSTSSNHHSTSSNKYSKAEETNPSYGLNFNFFTKNAGPNTGHNTGHNTVHNMPNNYGNFIQDFENSGSLRDNMGVQMGAQGGIGYNNRSQGHPQQKKDYQNRQMNPMDFSEINTSSDGMGFNGNMNQLHFNFNSNRDGNTPVKRNHINSGPNEGSNPFNTCVSSNSPVDPEDYTVEMFGRKGWICEMCNNFNYESKFIFNYF